MRLRRDAVETVASKLQETGQHISKQRDAFITRTRDASTAFFGETRDAGLQLIGAVRTEAKRWRRYATQRAAKVQSGVRAALSLPAVERALLTQVDETLRALDTRVRNRLSQLEPKEAPETPRKAAATPASKSKGRARKSKPALPPIAA
jgi:hypothetical protein